MWQDNAPRADAYDAYREARNVAKSVAELDARIKTLENVLVRHRLLKPVMPHSDVYLSGFQIEQIQARFEELNALYEGTAG